MVVKDDAEAIPVLIADDDKATCLLLKTALTNWGYQVTVVEDGDSAWEVISGNNPPALLILDGNMPGQDGYTICTRIRNELASDYNPYIILLTQSGGQENIIKGLDAGANEFLTKPFSPAELQSRMAVGEKIVRYEAALKNQNDQLKSYIDKIEAASALVVNATSSLGHALEGDNEKNGNSHHIKNAHSALDEIVDVFKSFNPEKDAKKKK